MPAQTNLDFWFEYTTQIWIWHNYFLVYRCFGFFIMGLQIEEVLYAWKINWSLIDFMRAVIITSCFFLIYQKNSLKKSIMWNMVCHKTAFNMGLRQTQLILSESTNIALGLRLLGLTWIPCKIFLLISCL